MKNNRLKILIGAVVLILLVPLIAMQFTDEVTWDIGDFAVAAVLLFGTVLVIELVLRKVRSSKYRIVLCVAILAVLLLVWAELAVGIFGTPFAGS